MSDVRGERYSVMAHAANVHHILRNDTRTDLTGDCLWVWALERQPGFGAGEYYYITRQKDWKLLFKFEMRIRDEPLGWRETVHEWYPTHIHAEYAAGMLRLREDKFIDRDNRAVCRLDLENLGEETVEVTIAIETALTELHHKYAVTCNPGHVEWDNRGGDAIRFRRWTAFHFRQNLHACGATYHVIQAPGFTCASDNLTLARSVNLLPGECAVWTVVASIEHGDMETIRRRLGSLWEQRDPLRAWLEEFEAWFERNVPAFACPDPWVQKMWCYRWWLVYKNLLDPHLDYMQYPALYEGKHEFWGIVNLSVPMQIVEARWLRNPSYARGQALNVVAGQIHEGREHGRYRDTYTDWIPWAFWALECVHPDRSLLPSLLRSARKHVDWERSDLFVWDNDPLPVVEGSWRTGMESQPSFFEFTDPLWDHRRCAAFDRERQTAVKRTDETCYLYLNYQGVAAMAEALGHQETATRYRALASRLREATLAKMWDPDTEFFYDLQPGTDRKALQSKCVTGFLFHWAGLAGAEHLGVWRHLSAPKEFWTAWPAPTVAIDCPAYSPSNDWRIGPAASPEEPWYYGCSWNGPTWNFSNALVADSLGQAIHLPGGETLLPLFREFWERWTRLQYVNGDFNYPNTFEHHNPETGQPLRNIHDYFHSYYNDILIRHIIGLTPRHDDLIELRPIDMGWDHFALERVRYHGHDLDILWRRPGSTERPVLPEGFTLRIDGRLTFTLPHLQPVIYDIPSGTPMLGESYAPLGAGTLKS